MTNDTMKYVYSHERRTYIKVNWPLKQVSTALRHESWLTLKPYDTFGYPTS